MCLNKLKPRGEGGKGYDETNREVSSLDDLESRNIHPEIHFECI